MFEEGCIRELSNQIKNIEGYNEQRISEDAGLVFSPTCHSNTNMFESKKFSSQKVIMIFVPAANIFSYDKISSDKLWINSL